MPPAVPPHPLMPDLYRDNAEKITWLRRIFDDTAPDYDRVERWLSFGSGGWYRRQALRRAGLTPGMSVADIACGTGLLAREALTLAGPGRVVGIDPSAGMRTEAQRLLGIPTHDGLAESIPLPSASFDFVSMGYALRHTADLSAAFAEFSRILKPGGTVCILEISRPENPLRRAILRAHMRLICTAALALRRHRARSAELWRYYWRTIDECIPPARVTGALRDQGFTNVKHHVVLGIFSEYTATRPL